MYATPVAESVHTEYIALHSRSPPGSRHSYVHFPVPPCCTLHTEFLRIIAIGVSVGSTYETSNKELTITSIRYYDVRTSETANEIVERDGRQLSWANLLVGDRS